MNELLGVAISAASSAGKYIFQSASKINELTVTEKSLNDYVSDVDRHSEKIITSLILDSFPNHGILGEEYGLTIISESASESEYQWVIDPLDGTTNFLRSIPHYAVSIAVLYQGEPIIGVVYDAVKNEMFHAIKGEGAFLNTVKIGVSNRAGVEGALLATGIPFSGENLDQISSFTSTMEGLLELQTSGIRRLGAAALDLAYIACGRYDGFWEANLQKWDIAAGILLVTEAGGMVTDLNGELEHLISGNVLAGNTQVHQKMLTVTNKYYSD